MSYDIKISKIAKSRVEDLDFSNLPFGQVFSDHMFVADYIDGKWQNFEVKPIEPLPLHPSNLTLHYGQTIFEGMKAFLMSDNTPILYRPMDHAKRFNRSADRMCMPEIPEDLFIEAIEVLVKTEINWIPKEVGSALYLRPFMIAMDDVVGVKPSENYKFIVLSLPSGPYYSKPVNLKAEPKYVRAAKGGIGEAKTAGNYGASLYPFKKAKEEGFDQIMWLDAKEHKYVQEIGTMNIFFVIGDTVVTPKLDGSVLHGITRNSIITLLKDEGRKVEERLVSTDELKEAYDKGELKEMFGSGTAAIVATIDRLDIGGKKIKLDSEKYETAKYVRDYINGVRSGSKEDKFGWIHKIK